MICEHDLEKLIYCPDVGSRPCPVPVDLGDDIIERGLLVRSTNWLGDAIMSFPAVHRLGRIRPGGIAVSVLTPAKLAPIWELVSWVDEVIVFTGRRVDAACRKTLRDRRPGAVMVLPNSFGSAFDLRRAGLRHIVGRRGRGRTALLDHRLPGWKRVPGSDRHHETRKYLELAVACGVDDWGISYPPLVPAADMPPQLAVIGDDAPLLVIAPGAAYGPAKQWPADFYRMVTQWWAGANGGVAAVGSAAEAGLAATVTDGVTAAVNLAGVTDLRGLTAVLDRASLILCNDSGVMHLGAALGKAGVAIFGSTDPIATGPIGGRWVVMQHEVPCSPCLERTCPRSDHPYECLKSVTPEAVIDVLKAMRAMPRRSIEPE